MWLFQLLDMVEHNVLNRRSNFRCYGWKMEMEPECRKSLQNSLIDPREEERKKKTALWKACDITHF